MSITNPRVVITGAASGIVDVLLTGPAARFAYHLRRISLGLVRRATVRVAYQSGYLE